MNRIPVGKTIAYAYSFTLGHLGTIIGLAWLPLILIAVLQFLPYALGGNPAAPAENATAEGRQALQNLATSLLVLLLYSVIYVPVTRQALGLRQGTATVHFALGPPEFRVFGAILLLFVVVMAMLFGITLLGVAGRMLGGGSGGAPGLIFALLVLAALCGFIYAAIRFAFLILPVTVAEQRVSLTRGWVLTQGNFWRILAVILAVVLPILIAHGLIVVGIIGPKQFFASLPADAEAAARAVNARLAILSRHMPLYIGLNLILAPFSIGLNAGASAFAYRSVVPAEGPRIRE